MKTLRRKLRKAIAPLVVGAVAAGACALQSVIYGMPVPAIHDEFSNLLAADTFLHGRCTNPPHPLWEHFESEHILQRPTYATKYPPGQGLLLAAGRLLAGHAAPGVWLGMALACGASVWMLRAYVPRWWAVGGGLLMASRLGFSEWGWNYMGGELAVAGGAMLLGGWARVLRRPRWFPAAVMAAGLVVLAVSRPFEGLLLCLPLGVLTAVWLVRTRPPLRLVLRQVVVPALAVLLPAALAMCHYNSRVTGNPFRMPYQEYVAQYSAAPVLLVQAPYPPKRYRHTELHDFHVYYELGAYQFEHTWMGWWTYVGAKLGLWRDEYVGHLLRLPMAGKREFFLDYWFVVPLLALPVVLWQSPRTRAVVLAALFVLAFDLTIETWGPAHYVAPVACVFYLAVVQSLRRISLLRPGPRLVGRWVAGACLVAGVLIPALDLLPQNHKPTRPWAPLRVQMSNDLLSRGGRHLVVVLYSPDHDYHDEWVYNEADIDNAPIVWARRMDPEKLARLGEYYADRKIWVLFASPTEARLKLMREAVSVSGRTAGHH